MVLGLGGNSRGKKNKRGKIREGRKIKEGKIRFHFLF